MMNRKQLTEKLIIADTHNKKKLQAKPIPYTEKQWEQFKIEHLETAWKIWGEKNYKEATKKT